MATKKTTSKTTTTKARKGKNKNTSTKKNSNNMQLFERDEQHKESHNGNDMHRSKRGHE